eukprot:TRINITY_DN649_c0_g1_i4.p1 TRINITY_DN649_c0_g1~~TRINITY_DN649_c0_g1_i4.p1  ORF type:complete len:407 (+),score=94.86 TRINITY_DN649_c0_g1_i4:143-1363(+)
MQLYTVDYNELYINTVRKALRLVDTTRPFQSSSPTNKPIVDNTQMWVGSWGDGNSQTSGDVHFYSGGDCWDVSIFPRPRFASEYGYQSFPSMYTWATATLPSDWYIGSPMMVHRQHSPSWNTMLNDMISWHFHFPDNPDSEREFELYVYVSQIVQALCIKFETEHYRRIKDESPGHTMGAIYWQLNDIWQGPTWSSLEYGGRWKILHNYAVEFFADTLVSSYEYPSDTWGVYAVSDAGRQISGWLDVALLGWSDGATLRTWSSNFTLPAYQSSRVFQNYISSMLSGTRGRTETVLELSWRESPSGNVLSTNNFYLSGFQYVNLPKPTITVKSITSVDSKTATVTVVSSAMAPFVFLQTDIEGRFSKNAFLLKPGVTQQVTFYGASDFTTTQLQSTLTITSLRDSYP